MNYIPLRRRFAEYTFQNTDHDGWDDIHSSDLYARFTWENILGNRCTVVVGESGTGKSAEFKHQAKVLRSNGKAGFFCRLEDLANLPLQSALEIGSSTDLDTWLAGADEGWFFLDAIDEAKLINLRQFEWAIGKFVEVISAHRSRVHIVISTRPHAWEAYGDLEMLCEKLDLKVPKQIEGEEGENTEDDSAPEIGIDLSGESTDPGQSGPASAKPEELRVLTLAPLGPNEIRAFATALGVEDVAGFMTEVERANADEFANRPADLPGLIELWRKTKRIGNYSDVVLQNITIKLKELNPRHQQVAALTPERALQGAERLAAAATFSRRSSLLLPDRSPLDAKVRDELLDPKDVLLDWRPAEVHELLGRGLFDESLYGSVRFHHRKAREYLAARWLRRLLGQRKHRRSVGQLLFVKPYGTEKAVAPPSLKPVLGWLALWDQDIRDTALRVDPKLLLEFGDASGLPPDIRGSMLRGFAARYTRQNHTPLKLDLRELRRLASDQLLPTIKELLDHYSDHNDVRHLLLRLLRTGKISGGGAIALPYATILSSDTYSRLTAIQTIGAVGDAAEKVELKQRLLSAPLGDRDLLAAIIEALHPNHLAITELPSLIAAAEQGRESGYDSLQQELIRILENENADARLQLLVAIVDLLITPPLVESWCRISRKYAWLIPSATAAAKKIVAEQPDGPFDRSVLLTISLALQAQYLRLYVGEVEEDAKSLLAENRELKHATFWHEVDKQRQMRPTERIQDAWGVVRSQSLMPLELDDAPFLLGVVREKALPDDKFIALSSLVTIYARFNKPSSLLNEIRDAIRGVEELEAELGRQLNPPELSPEHEALQKRTQQMQRRADIEERRSAQKRQESIDWLRENIDKIAVGDNAREGKVLRSINFLRSEVLAKDKRNNSRWAVSGWRLLEPEFGADVAAAFRDYCKACWRLYRPSLRSERERDANSTPNAVVIGLSGLAMEAADDPDWATKLTSEEVAVATRYALWEMNALPSWLARLFDARPEEVKLVLTQEMAWEISQPRAENTSGYVFSRLRWTSSELGKALHGDIIELLSRNPAADATALTEALTVILRNPAALPAAFLDTLATRAAETEHEDFKSLWIAGLLCTDAPRAVPMLEEWVNAGTECEARERHVSKVLAHIWGDGRYGFGSEHHTYRSADLLLRLIKLTHTFVNPAEDLVHEDGYSPGLRDYAQDARSRIIKLLIELPGKETYDALLELSDFHSETYPKDRMLVLAEARAEADTEHEPWAPDDVDAFATEAERAPLTQSDLFGIALSRLDDLKLELEEGDESEAALLQRVANEPELRRVIANRLRYSSAGKYTTGSEEELADTSRTDIRLHHPAVEARIPIELKIADRRHWTAATLREMLERQLTGQYLREARFGIFLLVQRGASSDRKSWTHPLTGKRINFGQLVDWLVQEARDLIRANPSIDGLAVVSIDLTQRGVSKTVVA